MKAIVSLGFILGICAMIYAGVIWWIYLKDPTEKPASFAEAAKIEITSLSDGFSVLQGAGGHITVLTGPDGVLLVDSGDVGTHKRVLTALEALGSTDVVYVINTHSHGDHRGGNAAFRRMGADIIAHRNTYANIQTDQHSPAGPEALPTIIVDDTYDFTFNGQDISLLHSPLAHTNGDILVFFKQANIVAAGDAFINESLPFISLGAGASLDSHLAGLRWLLPRLGDETTVVPGHGIVTGKAAVQDTYDHLLTIRNYIAWLKSHGVSAYYLPLFHPLYAWPTEWRKGNGWEKFWLRMVYRALPDASL